MMLTSTARPLRSVGRLGVHVRRHGTALCDRGTRARAGRLLPAVPRFFLLLRRVGGSSRPALGSHLSRHLRVTWALHVVPSCGTISPGSRSMRVLEEPTQLVGVAYDVDR